MCLTLLLSLDYSDVISWIRTCRTVKANGRAHAGRAGRKRASEAATRATESPVAPCTTKAGTPVAHGADRAAAQAATFAVRVAPPPGARRRRHLALAAATCAPPLRDCARYSLVGRARGFGLASLPPIPYSPSSYHTTVPHDTTGWGSTDSAACSSAGGWCGALNAKPYVAPLAFGASFLRDGWMMGIRFLQLLCLTLHSLVSTSDRAFVLARGTVPVPEGPRPVPASRPQVLQSYEPLHLLSLCA